MTKKAHRTFRGPLVYFAVAGLLGAVCAIPLLAPTSIYSNPNPIGYLVILLSLPIGGLVYRIRARNWPIDNTVRQRQWRACLATLLLPMAIAMMTGMRAQGFRMTILGGDCFGDRHVRYTDFWATPRQEHGVTKR